MSTLSAPGTRVFSTDRLTELVVALSGTDDVSARGALDDAMARHGVRADKLLNVADALVSIRGDEAGVRERVGAPA